MRSRLGKGERRARENSVIGETSRHLTCLMESQPKLIGFGDYILEKSVWGRKTLHENSRRNESVNLR